MTHAEHMRQAHLDAKALRLAGKTPREIYAALVSKGYAAACAITLSGVDDG